MRVRVRCCVENVWNAGAYVEEEDVADGRARAPRGDALLDEVEEAQVVGQQAGDVHEHHLGLLVAQHLCRRPSQRSEHLLLCFEG